MNKNMKEEKEMIITIIILKDMKLMLVIEIKQILKMK